MIRWIIRIYCNMFGHDIDWDTGQKDETGRIWQQCKRCKDWVTGFEMNS